MLIDNYDSFTYNLVHYLLISGVEVEVIRNDEIDLEKHKDGYSGYVISPGPCTPQESGKLLPFLGEILEKKTVLGVCLGHQAIGMHYGCQLIKAKIPFHGKASMIHHDGNGIFKEIENPMQVGRYHSLIIKGTGTLKTNAILDDEIMALSIEEKKVFGVQFHPESVLTPQGLKMIRNWIGYLE